MCINLCITLGVFRSTQWGYWGYGDMSIWLFVSKPRDIKCCYEASYPKYDFHVFLLRVFVILGIKKVSSDTPKIITWSELFHLLALVTSVHVLAFASHVFGI
jgi:hypothetical protein